MTYWVAGESADRVPITSTGDSAGVLARFLRALHVEAPVEAPTNPRRGVPISGLTNAFDERLDAVALRVDVDVVGVRNVWEDAVSGSPWHGARLWLHGDLHPANVVVEGGAVAGIIDFGDICVGDPATDLAAAWMLFPAHDVARFFELYGVVDAPTMRRARGWAVLRGLGLVGIGQAWERGLPGGQRTWGAAGRTTLNRILMSG